MFKKTIGIIVAAASISLLMTACSGKKESAGPSANPSVSPVSSASASPAHSHSPVTSVQPIAQPSSTPSPAATASSPKTSAPAGTATVSTQASVEPSHNLTAAPQPNPSVSSVPTVKPQPTPTAIVTPAPSATARAGTASAGDTSLKITATNWKFDQSKYEVAAGKEITVDFNSAEGLHGLKIEGTNVNLKETGTMKVTLKPGVYKISCIVLCGPSHGNMVATIVAN